MEYGLLHNQESVLSTENIQVQKDTNITKILSNHFSVIGDAVADVKGVVKKTNKRRDVRIALANIDKAISNRFGFTVKTVLSETVSLAVQTVSPKVTNILADNVKNKYDDISESLKEEGDNTSKVKYSDIDTRTASWVDSLVVYKQSIDAMDKQLQTGSIVVDLENAKMHGYPSDAIVMIYINPSSLFHTYKLSSNEVAAAYLHEVGHAFTHLEYSHRTIKQTSMLIESIISEANKGKSPLDAVKLSYKNTFEDDSLDDAKNMVSVAVGVTSRYLSTDDDFGGNTYSSKDSERLADQFATRFGVGDDLASALGKLHTINDNVGIREVQDLGVFLIKGFVVAGFVGIFSSSIGIMIGLSLAFMTAYIVGLVIMGFAIYVLYNLISGLLSKGIDSKFPYDNPKRRITRIKNELVRQLRTEKVSKDVTSAMLASIDTMLVILNKLDDKDENFIFSAIGTFFSYTRSQTSMREFDNLTEDLINNDLHVISNKIKTI